MTKPTLDWSYEYLPYTLTNENGVESDLPNFRIFPDDEPERYVAETNEHLPGDLQESHARLIAAAPHLLGAVRTIAADPDACTCHTRSWYGTLHDTQCSVRIAGDAIALATTS
jgi:hypothetical protein